MSEEQTFKVTEYVSQEKELTKTQYVARLNSKLDYAFEKNADIIFKMEKLRKEQEVEKEKMAQVLAELIKLEGKEIADKALEYSQWRYKELYPKKAKMIYSKVSTLT